MVGAQILVVEDERVVALCLQTELQSMGYLVSDVASSGKQAIEHAKGTHPDLVLMDIMLKGDMDGLQAADHIRRRLDIPVVYLTAYEDDNTLSKAKLTEPYGYLLKPYEKRELHAAIEIAIFRHRIDSQVKATERWLARTLQSIGEAMIATDAQLLVRLLNPSAERLLGCAAEDVFGRDLAGACCIICGEEPVDITSLAAVAAREGKNASLGDDLVLVAADGHEVPIEGTLAPILDGDHHGGYVLTVRDRSAQQSVDDYNAAFRHN